MSRFWADIIHHTENSLVHPALKTCYFEDLSVGMRETSSAAGARTD